MVQVHDANVCILLLRVMAGQSADVIIFEGVYFYFLVSCHSLLLLTELFSEAKPHYGCIWNIQAIYKSVATTLFICRPFPDLRFSVFLLRFVYQSLVQCICVSVGISNILNCEITTSSAKPLVLRPHHNQCDEQAQSAISVMSVIQL